LAFQVLKNQSLTLLTVEPGAQSTKPFLGDWPNRVWKIRIVGAYFDLRWIFQCFPYPLYLDVAALASLFRVIG